MVSNYQATFCSNGSSFSGCKCEAGSKDQLRPHQVPLHASHCLPCKMLSMISCNKSPIPLGLNMLESNHHGSLLSTHSPPPHFTPKTARRLVFQLRRPPAAPRSCLRRHLSPVCPAAQGTGDVSSLGAAALTSDVLLRARSGAKRREAGGDC